MKSISPTHNSYLVYHLYLTSRATSHIPSFTFRILSPFPPSHGVGRDGGELNIGGIGWIGNGVEESGFGGKREDGERGESLGCFRVGGLRIGWGERCEWCGRWV